MHCYKSWLSKLQSTFHFTIFHTRFNWWSIFGALLSLSAQFCICAFNENSRCSSDIIFYVHLNRNGSFFLWLLGCSIAYQNNSHITYMHTFTYSMGELFLESRVVEWSLVRVHNRTLYLTFAYIWIFPVINLSLVEENFKYDDIEYQKLY